MRTPHEIAGEAHSLATQSVAQCVPMPLERIASLSVEFMVSMTEGFAEAVAEAVAAAAAAAPKV